VTLLLLGGMNLFPGLRLRVTPEVERNGIDLGELGASAYEFHEELLTQLNNEREFGILWRRLGDTRLPFYVRCGGTDGGGEGRKFDYAAQEGNFWKRNRVNLHQ